MPNKAGGAAHPLTRRIEIAREDDFALRLRDSFQGVGQVSLLVRLTVRVKAVSTAVLVTPAEEGVSESDIAWIRGARFSLAPLAGRGDWARSQFVHTKTGVQAYR
jgi:hypothetical protein